MMRKKLKDIDGNFHCSIIGTCLTIEETRTLLESTHIYSDYTGFSDYDMHGTAVGKIKEASCFSNRVTAKLNSKYMAEVFQASKASTSSELEAFWSQSFEVGSVPGAFWALLSHPFCSDEVRSLAFGDIHMLSHKGANEVFDRR